MNLKKYYIIMILEIISIIIFYSIQGYNYNSLLYNLLYHSLPLLLSIKVIIILVVLYLNIFTRCFYNRSVYILLKIYIILVILEQFKILGS